jgi:NADH:ubiquinone oxidoreductase subunit H
MMLSFLLWSYCFSYIIFAIYTIEYFIIFWLVLIGVFVQIMFFTTCERKALALIQRRVGPRVVGVRGRLQYIADSVKLLTKVFVGPRRTSAAMFQGAAFGGF